MYLDGDDMRDVFYIIPELMVSTMSRPRNRSWHTIGADYVLGAS